jgi:hypothetical protein
MGNQFYSELGYDEFLTKNSEIGKLYPEFVEIEQLGADRVYFSGKNPTVLFVEVKCFDTVNLKKIAEIQHKAWNYRKILLLFALSDTEIRIYNCQEKPEFIGKEDDPNKKLSNAQIFSYDKTSDEQALNILSEVFSRIGVDCGLLWTTDYEVKSRINIQCRLDKYLVNSLKKTAIELKSDIPQQNIIHALLMRSLFILFLEDKGAANEAGLYEKILPGASSYFEILDDINATYQLFNEVQIHFNGNVFPIIEGEAELVKPEHLRLIKKCFTDGDLSNQPKLFRDWKLFNFKIIQIELLSEIYENFLGELKHEKGQFYTPFSLVELILNDKLPIDQTDFKTKVLDPACGSGIFLVETYKRLVKRWKKANPTERISFDTLTELLLSNIYGIEIDPTAIKVAAFSLYLALVDELDPKTLWIEPNYQLPYLIYDPEDPTIKTQGKNLWRRDTIGQVNADEFVKVDLVVGNPPFGTKDLKEKSKSIYAYCKDKKFGKEMVLPFLHKAVSFCPEGEIALIFNTKVLTNTEGPFQHFRKWLFTETYVEKVYNLSIFRKAPKNYGGQLFSTAIGPVSIVYYQKENPLTISDTIEYWAPKTYVKSNLIEGVIVDSTDIKYLPRVECQKPNTKIWKIAMWGGMQDFRLIEKIKHNSLGIYFKKNRQWVIGSGLNGDNEHPDFVPDKLISTEKIERYYTKPNNALDDNRKYFRKNNNSLFIPPFILFKKGQNNKRITASLFEEYNYCTTGAFVLNGDVSIEKKKLLVSYLNSDFVRYYLFLVASSWGIEREQIFLSELLEIPSIFLINENDQKNILNSFDTIAYEIKANSIFSCDTVVNKEADILRSIFNFFKISPKESIIIQDVLNISLNLFEKGQNSIALHRTLQPENLAYANMLCSELNTFLNSSKTRVSACIYDVALRDPLNMVVLHFGNKEKPVEEKSIDALRESLKNIDRYMLKKTSDSIFVQKQVKYFDYENDLLYLIKPNQKRFWTRSQAIDDATSLIAEIINMEEE